MANGFRAARGVCAIACLAVASLALGANPVEVDRGLQWLAPRIANGAVAGENASLATPFQVRTEVLLAVQRFGTGNAALADSVAAEPDESTEYLARQIIALAAASRDTLPDVTALAGLQNPDGGFGAAAGFLSNALDTGFALLAFKAAGSANATVLGRTVAALSAMQAADGSFSIDEQPSVYVTSVALAALGAYAASFAVTPQVTAAKGFLASRQVGGTYASTVDLAMATIALAATSVDGASFAALQQSLRERQRADYSWGGDRPEDTGGDPFMTALAIRALGAVASAAAPATTGQASGRVLEDGGAPIAGAAIDLAGPQLASAISGADGRFTATTLLPGSYTARISKAGYATASVALTVLAGVNANLGDVRLALGSSSAGLQGTVRHGVTGEPIAAARVQLLGGAFADSDAAGNYRIAGALPGSYSVTVSKAGFDTVTAGGTFAAGTMVVFSPSLYPSGQSPNAASVKGRVVSATSQAAIPNASVTIDGVAAPLDAAAGFQRDGLTAGPVSIAVTAPGFLARTFTTTLAVGMNDVGALALPTAASTVTISGRVSERNTNLPIANAAVSLQGSPLTALTNANGNYVLAGVAQTQFTLSVTAIGYVVRTFDVTLPQLADATVDFVLDPVAASTGLSVVRLTLDKGAYEPYTAVEIEMEVENATPAARVLDFSAVIYNAQGNAILRTAPRSFAIAPSGRTEVELETHVTHEPPGEYSVVMQGIDADGALHLERSARFTLNSFASISGGVALNPPIVQAGTSQPVTVAADLFNYGNVAIAGGEVELVVTLENPEAGYNPVGQVTTGPPVVTSSLNRPVGGSYDANGVLWILNAGTRAISSVAPDFTVTEFMRLDQQSPPMNDPINMTRDDTGNLWVVATSGAVWRITADKVVQQRLVTGLLNSTAITVTPAGLVLVAAENSTGPIFSINRVTGAPTPHVLQGFSLPAGVAGAADGTLYVTNKSSNSISRVSPSGAVTTFATGLSTPIGIAVDAQGQVFVANSGANKVVRFSADGATRADLPGTLSSPTALAFDNAGNLLVSTLSQGLSPPGAIVMYPMGAGTPQTFAQSMVAAPQGMVYDSQGSLYVVGSKGAFRKRDASGNVSDLASLPANAFGVTLGPEDKPFVTVSGNGNVIRYDSPTSTFIYSGTGLVSPRGIASNGGNLLYVAENSPSRISSLDVVTRERKTIADAVITTVNDMHFASNGDRYYLNGSRIHRLRGIEGSVFAQSGFNAQAMTASPSGGFYLQETFTVRVMDANGGIVRSIGNSNSLARGIATDASGFILVGDTGTRNIIRINPATGVVDSTPFASVAPGIPSSFAAIVGDGAGGLFAAGSLGQIVQVPSTGGNASLLGSITGESPNRLAFDASTNTLYVKMSSSVYAFDVATRTSRKVLSVGDSAGSIIFANGLLHVGFASTEEVVSYTPLGVEVSSHAGLSTPSFITWDGSRMLVADSKKTIAITPGELPRTFARDTANFITYVAGAIYGTKGAVLVKYNPASGKYETYYDPRVPGTNDIVAPYGIAARADGTVAWASQDDHRLVILDAARQVTASYAGVGDVTAMAVDPAGYVYAASTNNDFRQVSRIDPVTRQSRVYVPFGTPSGLTYAAGALYGSSNGSSNGVLNRYDAQGAATIVATGEFGTALEGLVARNNVIYAVDRGQLKVRRVDGDQLTTFASGLLGVTALRAGADGALYTASKYGSVTRIVGAELRPLATDLGPLSSLGIAASGRVFAGTTAGYVTALEPVTFRRIDIANFAAMLGTNNPSVGFVTPDAGEKLSVAVGTPGELYRLAYAPPPPPPVPGTVIGQPQRATAGALAVGTAGIKATFPNWVPPHGGDFRFTVRRIDGTPGEVSNVIHVGSAAAGSVTLSRSTVPAGASQVRVSTRVTGADSTSLSEVHAARIERVPASNFNGAALGADALGNIYMAAGHITRITPQGVFEVAAWTPPAGNVSQFGSMPVDNSGAVYAVAGAQNRTIYKVRIAPAVPAKGVIEDFIELPDSIRSIVRDSQDVIWALGKDSAGLGVVYRVTMGNAAERYRKLPTTAPIRDPYALTIDGKDNLYAFNGYLGVALRTPRTDGVIKIDKNSGAISLVVGAGLDGDPQFEFEGMSIAGTCTDNLMIAPIRWKKYGQGATTALYDIEEHVLVQLTGRTGQVAKVVDARQIDPVLEDFDDIVYDRFSQSLLVRNHGFIVGTGNSLYRIPITCGAISTELHVVIDPGQPASGFTPAPSATLQRDDGSRELVWRLEDVDATGATVSFDTVLERLAYGEKRAVAREAFLTLQNSFATGASVKVPVSIPAVTVDGQLDVASATDRPFYGANTDVLGTITVRSRDSQARTATLAIDVSDAQGVPVATLATQAVTLAAGQVLPVPVTFNTQSNLAGGYRLQARLSEAAGGAALSADTAFFDIVAEGTRVLAGLGADKPEYDALDMVTITARMKNVAVNAIASGLSVTLALRSAAGVEVLRESRTVATLVPGAFQDVVFQYRLKAADIGTFTADLTVSDPTVTARTTSFTVLSSVDTGTGLRGSVTATPNRANAGDSVELRASIKNFGNAPFTALPVTLRVVNPATSAEVARFDATLSVAQNGEAPMAKAWDTAAAPAGVYVVAASTTVAGRDIALGQATITLGALQAFQFQPRVNIEPGETVESETITITGTLAPSAVTISEGGEYRIGSGGWSGIPGTVVAGDQVTVRVNAAATFDTASAAELRVGPRTASFEVRTRQARTTPDAFAFVAQTGVPLNSLRTSNPVTISGIEVAVPIAISGGGQYVIEGAPATDQPGMIAPGAKVAVTLTSASTSATPRVATLTVGGVSAAFSVTTTLQLTVPNAFSFVPQNGVARDTLVTSNPVTISGINVGVPISIAGGEYRIGTAEFTTTPGTVLDGNTVQVRARSSSEFDKTVTATLTVSGVSASFLVTTEGEDRTPENFVFAPRIGVPIDQPVVSDAVDITGINTPVPISILGGEFQVNDRPFTAAAGSTVTANDKVKVRVQSSQQFDTPATATLTVSTVTAPFTVTTKKLADVTPTPSFPRDARVLLLVSCKVGGVEDGEDDPPCVEQRRTFLGTYLAELGISHRITVDADSFKAELRSGRYNTYWISGGAKKLKDLLAEELREATARGDTLVMDGVHDERNKDLDEVMGITYRGKPSQLSLVTLASSFLPAGNFTVAGTAPIRVLLTSALRQARFNTGDPAIATNEYGSGKGLLFAFDLTGTLLAQSASALLRGTVDDAISEVTPAVPSTYAAGAYVPLTMSLKNEEPVAVNLEVTATLPGGFTLAAGAPPAVIAGNQVRWSMSVAAGTTGHLEWAVRAATAPGTYTITIDVSQAYSGTVVPVGTYPVTVQVSSASAALPALATTLQALALPTDGQRAARDAAVARLQEASAAIGQGAFETAIARLIAAVASLEGITTVTTAEYQATIDRALQEVQERWWAALAPCPGATPCRTP